MGAAPHVWLDMREAAEYIGMSETVASRAD